jgi:hypothetical protein
MWLQAVLVYLLVSEYFIAVAIRPDTERSAIIIRSASLSDVHVGVVNIANGDLDAEWLGAIDSALPDRYGDA